MSATELDVGIGATSRTAKAAEVEEKIVHLGVARRALRRIVHKLDLARRCGELEPQQCASVLGYAPPECDRARAGIGSGQNQHSWRWSHQSYLQRRPLDDELDRGALVKLGLEYLKQADDMDAAAAAAPRE